MSESDDSTSFETERHRDDQPPREDLLDPEEIEIHREPRDLVDELNDRDTLLPDPEERPESQGNDVLDADRLTEDGVERRRGPTPPG